MQRRESCVIEPATPITDARKKQIKAMTHKKLATYMN